MTMTLTSAAFRDGDEIPSKYTCEGEDVAPPLAWNRVPANARALALIVDDPDAPDPAAPKVVWVHWLLYDVPADAHGLPERGAPLPEGTREGRNDWKRAGYGGPCPPIGRHRYFFRLFALDAALGDLRLPDRHALERAMRPHVLAEAVLMGTYQKHGRGR